MGKPQERVRILENQGIRYELIEIDRDRVELICQQYPEIRAEYTKRLIGNLITEGMFTEIEDE